MAIPIQFWIGWRWYSSFWDGLKAKASNMNTLIAIGTTAAFLYNWGIKSKWNRYYNDNSR